MSPSTDGDTPLSAHCVYEGTKQQTQRNKIYIEEKKTQWRLGKRGWPHPNTGSTRDRDQLAVGKPSGHAVFAFSHSSVDGLPAPADKKSVENDAIKLQTSNFKDIKDNVSVAGDDDEDGGAYQAKSQTELNNLVGGDDDDLDLKDLNGGSDDDEFDDSDLDVEEAESIAVPESKEQKYKQKLSAVAAAGPYSHIAYKLKDYTSYFRSDDNAQKALFSRSCIKVAKKDNSHPRDLVITSKYIYLFARGTFGGIKARVIDIDQVVGCIESTVESSLVAIIIPSFHDVLIRITPQNSMVGGTEAEVKTQLIASLFEAHHHLVQGRPFLLREVENVRSVIRRSEDDSHLPLQAKPYDILKVASNKNLYPSFRTNADSVVYFSLMVMRVNAQRDQSPKSLCVTDSAMYIMGHSLDRISKRIPLNDIAKILYDTDSQGILFQCSEVDTMLIVKAKSDFDNLLKWVPEVAMQSIQHIIKVSPSHQLFSAARLVDKNMMDALGAGADATRDGLKQGAKLTQKLLLRSWKLGLKSVEMLAQGLVNITETSVDLVKSGVVGVGEALVDNALTNELLGVAGAAGGMFLQQQKLLFETCITVEDEEKQLTTQEMLFDQLKLQGNPSLTQFKLGTIYYSSRGHRFNISSHLDREQTSPKIIIVCDRGVFLFEDPTVGESGIVSSALSLFRSSKGLIFEEGCEWKAFRGLLSCVREGNLVSLLTNEEKSSDIMLRIPNIQLAEKFMRHTCKMYAAMQSTNDGRFTLPVYKTDKVEQMKLTLKKTMFDPVPTIALRTNVISDQLHISMIPDVADTLRRFGDNTVIFSGLAFRLRSLKKGDDVAAIFSLAAGEKGNEANKKNFKSFVLVVTNAAIYAMTKGGYEITRRTEIRLVKGIFTSVGDPDAVLLKVPADGYDILCRIEGRAREFIERVQHGIAAWTDHGLVFPQETKEGRAVHQISDYVGFRVVAKQSIVDDAQLDRPAGFDERQAKRSALEVAKSYNRWFQQDLSDALIGEKTLKKRDAALTGTPEETEADSNANLQTWAQFQAYSEERNAAVFFSYSRAFIFGFRPNTLPKMAEAAKEVEKWKQWKEAAHNLTEALAAEDVDAYEELLDVTGKVDGIGLLLREQRAVYKSLREKKDMENEIRSLITGQPLDAGPGEVDPDHDVEDKLEELSKLFRKAIQVGVKPTILDQLRAQLDTALQRQRLSRYLKSLRGPKAAAMSESTRELLMTATESLQLDVAVRNSLIKQEDPLVNWASKLLEAVVETGNVKSIQDAIERVKESAAGSQCGALISDALEQIALIEKHRGSMERLQVLCSKIQNVVDMPEKDVSETLQKIKDIHETIAGVKALKQKARLAGLYITRTEQFLAKRKQEFEAKKKEEEFQAEYKSRLAQRERDEQKAVAEEQAKEDAEIRARHEHQIKAWKEKVQRLEMILNQKMTLGDSQAVLQARNNCSAISSEVQSIFKSNYQEREQRHFLAEVESIVDQLTKAQNKAQLWLDDHMTVGDPNTSPKTRYEEAYRAHHQEFNLPEHLIEEVKALNKSKVVAFVQAHQGQLDVHAIEKIRSLWQAASVEAQWVAELHHGIHTAVALKSAQLLEAQLDLAKNHGNYKDRVVSGARALLESMKASEQLEKAGFDAQKEAQQVEGQEPQGPPPCPQPSIPPLPADFSGPPGSKGNAIRSLHGSMQQLLTAMADNKASPTRPTTHILVPENSMPVKNIVEAFNQAFIQRVKPSGFFSKVPRTLHDIFTHLAGLAGGGKPLCPSTKNFIALYNDIKKYNNPEGHSSSQMLIRYAFHKGAMHTIVEEICGLPPKELENLWYEDSLWRAATHSTQVKVFAYSLHSQVEWSFVFHEGLNTEVNLTGAPSGAFSPPRAGSVGSTTTVGSPMRPTFSSNAGQDNPIPLLRRAVDVISQLFSSELSKLGKRTSPDEIRGIFDENRNKSIGITVRENLCVGLNNILLSGFKPTFMMMKRHPWELIVATANQLRQSARALGGVGIPDAVDMVLSLTDPNVRGRSGANLKSMPEMQLLDIRTRMLMCHMLNQHTLQDFFQTVFEQTPKNEEHLKKYYVLEKCCMFMPGNTQGGTSMRSEIFRILVPLSRIPFLLCIDAEIW